MKTPQEWSHIHGVIDAYQDKQEALVQFISSIQQDAFDSGRAAQMRLNAAQICDVLPMSAQVLREHADQIDPPSTKSDVEVQK